MLSHGPGQVSHVCAQVSGQVRTQVSGQVRSRVGGQWPPAASSIWSSVRVANGRRRMTSLGSRFRARDRVFSSFCICRSAPVWV